MLRDLSDVQLDEMAASAEALLNDPVVDMAISNMRSEYLAKLIIADIGTPEATSAHMCLKMLTHFKASLAGIITERKMRARRSQ